MASKNHSPALFRFGTFEVNARSGELHKQGVRIKIQEQPLRVLAVLLQQPFDVVTREELRAQIWPEDTFVDFDSSLNTAINRLRDALGDSADNPRFIETLPRRGYRFLLPVIASDGKKQTISPDASASGVASKHGRKVALALTSVALVLGSTALLWLTQRVQRFSPGQYMRLTNDGHDKSGNLSDSIRSPIVTDGSRLYFVEPTTGASVSGLVEVSVAGGDILSIPTPFRNVRLTDISPDRTHLLVGDIQSPTAAEVAFYSLPTVGGTAQRLGDFLAHDASWSPDGLSLAYATGDSLNVARQDGTGSKKLVDGLGAVWWPRWSPDGSRLRFTVTQPKTQDNAIWEIAADGANLREASRDWNLPGDQCCGSWTPDGSHFVFQSSQLGMTKIYAVSDPSRFFGRSHPVELGSGPLWSAAPALSADGKKLFLIGWQPRTELIRYDRKLKQFVSFLPAISASALDFTRDGKWVVYTQYPEGNVWRSRADGKDRVQLTSGALYAFRPRWSPDATNIVFFGPLAHHPWKLYLLHANGGTPTQLIPGDENEGDPTWSPDGKRIAFGRLPWMPGTSQKPELYILDLASKGVTPLPGSQGLFSPRWSPSGRYIAALDTDSTKLMLYDFQTGSWRLLVQRVLGDPEWSHDDSSVYAIDVHAMSMVRIQINGRMETLASLNAERVAVTDTGIWIGLSPDDSVMTLRDLSAQELYSLELKTR
jgi:Tol biopolymer transport system component/DNA-binding winged helix-turn-helix (wHTH) protein